MEQQLKCVLELSLKEMVLRRLAVVLWNLPDILASIAKFRLIEVSNNKSIKEWQENIEQKVKDKVLKLKLSKSLMKQMIDIVNPIGLEIRRWKECHEGYFCNSHKEISSTDLAKLCWTMAGTINYGKTAQELVRCDVLDVVQRYKLACLYCLEDYIPLLSEELPEEMKNFCNEKATLPYMQFCWPRILTGELCGLDYLLRTSDINLTTFNQWAFEYSVENCNKTAAEYFFQKLTHEEREASLMLTAHVFIKIVIRDIHSSEYPENFPKEKVSDVLCFLLSLMSPEQQMKILKALDIEVLLTFLDWPWQDLFLEIAGLIWTFFPPSRYGDLLRKMADRFESPNYYFPKLFQEFFMQSPLDFKKYFVDEQSDFGPLPACRFLSLFFGSEDSECIEVIFRNVDAADRVKLVFHHYVLGIFYDYMLQDRWHMVEVCLREATLSKEDRVRLKEIFRRYLEIDEAQWWMEGFLQSENRGQIEWERFSEFLDGTDVSEDEEKKARKPKEKN